MLEGILKCCSEDISDEDKNSILNMDFNQSIDQIRAPINNADLEDILSKQETADDGGIVAMTGFYYQMMVSVLYLGEVFLGKWDGMYLDYHQDIVLFNNSEKIVKFVQVKTKNRSYSPADIKIANSWIPKLFITAYNIEKLSGFDLRFEIVSNCFYQDTKSFNISQFYPNSADKSDKQIKKLVAENFDAEHIESESTKDIFLNQAFQNFNMKHFLPEELEDKIATSIPKILGFEYSQLSTEILNQVIAEFFNACYDPKDASIQLIKDEKLNNLREYIKKKLTDNLTKEYHSKSDEKILTQYFTKLDSDYSNSKLNSNFISEFKLFVDGFREDLENILSDCDLTMKSIINLYLKYNKGIDVKLEERECESHFNDLLSLLLFLKISIKKNLMIEDENRHILSIKLDRLLFLILGNNDDMRDSLEVIKNFKDLFPMLDNSEKLRIASTQDVSIIISGQFDNENSDQHIELKKEELDFSLNPSINNSKLDEINANNITEVQIPINILYAHRDNLNAVNKTRKQYNNLKEMQKKIDEELKLNATS
ncbi:hypothetical protein [Streptococcus oralis]|uniref:CD-NTase associated protein 4-like DNA endonuclease domain-containing protein n=1 Tax=Streptococcus oralis TaxID=1303 RepID=A0A139PD89_STROR|nr:hypothetical protein [Streptococcus oralis]KXT86291.1 hypothetical protein SORDD16_01045 [Streptococcus oralis]